MTTHAVANLRDLPRIPAGGSEQVSWTPIRHALGIGAFGVNAWHGDTGELVIEDHDELPSSDPGDFAGHEELYLVLAGHAQFVAGDDVIDAPEGTLIALPPHIRRKAIALSDATTILAVGAPRGEAFRPSAWERSAVSAAGLV
jgi:hypothetical protein